MSRQKSNTSGKCDCGCGNDLELGTSQFCFQCLKRGTGDFASTLKDCATKYRTCQRCDSLKDKPDSKTF